MALIKWKQIDPNLGSYGLLTGSLEVSGSLLVNGEVVTGVSGANQTLSLNGYELSISNGNTVTLPSASGGSTDTGSLINSASATGNIITFTKGDASTFSITIDTGSGGGSTDISALNTFTGSIQTQVDSLQTATGSYILASQTSSMTVLSASYAVSSSHEIITEVSSSHAVQADTASFISDTFISASAVRSGFGSGGTGSANVTYDGDRIISQQHLPGFFTSSFNPGTSGSIQDFLNAVFYPNTGPSFTSGTQFYVAEFTISGSTVTTLTATDPEGQSLTFNTQSGYTDDFVKVSSGGVVTLNTVPTTENFNTVNRGDGTLAHPVLVQVTDTFGGSDTTTIYLKVTANSAPVFRQTSVGGSIITSFTVSRNENEGTESNIGRIFFTDTNSDTITIRSQSDNSHFELVKNSTYIQLNQLTSSLDYETTSSYTMSITASDEHYEAGQDTDASSSLAITINVTDNLVPVVNNQTLSSINENSSNGASVDTITASDNESDSITFTNFTLSSLELDGSPVATGSYGGTSQLTDPHENPFQMDSSGNVTRKTGVYLNSDLINSYKYTVQVRDDYNTLSSPAIITIPIDDDTPATLTDNWSAGPYIVESDTSGTTIKTTVYGSTTADLNSNQSGTFTSSNAAMTINSSNGNLSLGVDLSGSVTQSGATIESLITFTNTFNTTTTTSVTASVLGNRLPTGSFSDQTSNLNTNLATTGTNMVSVTISDPDSDTPYSMSLSGTNASSFTLVPQNANSSSYQIHAASNLTAGTYNYSASIKDNYDEVRNYNRSLTIAQAGIGTMTTNGTFYVIESATNGNNVVTNSNGRTGTQGDLGVTYSPSYGSAAVASFTSSNAQIAVTNAGALSLAFDLSGSGTASGDTISSDITFRDQYDNIGSGSISINVTTNFAPDIIFADTSANHNTNLGRSGSILATLTFSDTEGDTINYAGVTFEGTGSQINAIQVGTSWRVQAKENLSASVYTYTASVQDEHQFQTIAETDSITIAAADIGTLTGDTAVYILESTASGAPFRDATGYENGNLASVGVSYSPNYGSAAVQSFTSSNAAIVIDGSGNLTLGVTLSGSVTQSGDTFSSTITFRDQYDNIGSGSVTATVFGNSSPVANFTRTSNYESDNATSGSTAGTLAVTDVENNSPFTFTVAGVNGDKFNVVGSSSPFTVQPTGSLSGGTYYVDLTVTDNYGESVTLTSESIVVTQSVDYGEVFVYSSTLGNDAGLTNAYNNVMGIGSEDSSVPPHVTSLTASTGSLIARFVSGSLGDSTINLSGGETATLLISASGNTSIDTVLSSSIGTLSTSIGLGQIVIVYPSGSSMGVPTSIQQSFNSTAGGVVPAFNVDGNGFGIEGAKLHSIDLVSPYDGYSKYFVVGRTTKDTIASNIIMRLVNSSGSLPS